MDAPQNPSAGKFDPPPNPTDPGQPRSGGWSLGGSRFWLGGLALLSIALRELAHTRRGTLAVLSGVLIFVVGAAQYMLGRKVQDESDDKSPYESSPNITR